MPNGTTVVDTETATVHGDGTYVTPNGFLPTAGGTYEWAVHYSGDANNNPASGDSATASLLTLATLGANFGGSTYAGLVMDAAGNLYGVNEDGGRGGEGDIFEVVRGSGTATVLASFDGSNGADPWVASLMDGAGNLYGTTAYGGPENDGTAFSIASWEQFSHDAGLF